jgi:hypothetical protein
MSYHYSKYAFLGPESWSTCKCIRTVLKLVFKCEKWMWDWNRVPVQYEKVKHRQSRQETSTTPEESPEGNGSSSAHELTYSGMIWRRTHACEARSKQWLLLGVKLSVICLLESMWTDSRWQSPVLKAQE